MKLKKIASLMLAGIMAVSMLAGCKSGQPAPDPEENNGGATAGYSAQLGDVVSDEVKDKEFVTFADNADDQAALEDAVGNLATFGNVTDVNFGNDGNIVWVDDTDAVAADFEDAAKLDRYRITNNEDSAFYADANMNEVRKVGTLFAVDGKVEMSKVLKQIANQADVKNALESLVEEGTDDNNTYKYNYTVSVSVVNVPVDALDFLTASVNYVAVTITRVPSSDVQ